MFPLAGACWQGLGGQQQVTADRAAVMLRLQEAQRAVGQWKWWAFAAPGGPVIGEGRVIG